MIGLPSSVRIYLATETVDLRKGPDGLSALVKRAFDAEVFSGHLFVFLSRRSDRVKIIWWDRGGYVVYYKRLERGRFRAPQLFPRGLSDGFVNRVADGHRWSGVGGHEG